MNLTDEFEVYDSCTADTLEVGDLIFYDDNLIEVHGIEDKLDIEVSGYSYSLDENIEYMIPFDYRLDLYKIRD